MKGVMGMVIALGLLILGGLVLFIGLTALLVVISKPWRLTSLCDDVLCDDVPSDGVLPNVVLSQPRPERDSATAHPTTPADYPSAV